VTDEQWYQKRYRCARHLIDGYTPRPIWTPEQTAQARAMRAEGVSYAAIGAAVGKTAKAAKRRLQRVA
jgi:hypothetical protein